MANTQRLTACRLLIESVLWLAVGRIRMHGHSHINTHTRTVVCTHEIHNSFWCERENFSSAVRECVCVFWFNCEMRNQFAYVLMLIRSGCYPSTTRAFDVLDQVEHQYRVLCTVCVLCTHAADAWSCRLEVLCCVSILCSGLVLR